jgi:hypothetical protein
MIGFIGTSVTGFLFSLFALQPNSGRGRLHETFRFTSVTRFRTVGRTPWTGDQHVARSLPVQNTEKRTHNIKIKYPCPEWDSKPRFRRLRERRHFMPRPLGYRDRYKFSYLHSIIKLSLFYTLSVHRCTRTGILRLY